MTVPYGSPLFITLTEFGTIGHSRPVTINLAEIATLREVGNGCIVGLTGSRDPIAVHESYDALVAVLADMDALVDCRALEANHAS